MKWVLAVLAALCLATSLSAQTVVRSGNYIVHSWTPTEKFARRVLAMANGYDSLPALPAAAPTFGQPINIYLASNDAQFRALTNDQAPEWGVGVAASELGVIVLRAYGTTGGGLGELPRVLRHELAHIALHRYLAPARVPRWFNEGYAVWAAGDLDTEAAWLLRVAFVTEQAPSLEQLELSWPAMTTDARVAYALAGSAVQYLVNESGTRGLDIFLRRWRESKSFEGALAATYGLSLDQLETHWRKDVKRRYGWLVFVTQTSVAFIFLTVAVMVLYFIRRRRDRRRLEQLIATEPPDLPAYWNEADEENEANEGNERDPPRAD